MRTIIKSESKKIRQLHSFLSQKILIPVTKLIKQGPNEMSLALI